MAITFWRIPLSVQDQGLPPANATADACRRRMPVIQLQRVAQIRFASIDTNVSGSNPKRPLHEHVHPHT
jgi:hypothetical protein